MILRSTSWFSALEKGIQFANEALKLNPHARGAYGALTCGYLGLNRARDFSRDVLPKDSENPAVHFNLLGPMCHSETFIGTERQLQWASTSSWGRDSYPSLLEDLQV